jgi:predicted nucleic acid-binding protein
MSVEFCDTNILVYAYDTSAGGKRDRAKQLLERLWDSENGAVSIQILQELFVSLTRKVVRPLSRNDARTIVADMATWQVVIPTVDDVLAASDGTARWKISFWDAMVLVTASRADATVLWSEDLSDGQTYDGVVARNPFRDVT